MGAARDPAEPGDGRRSLGLLGSSNWRPLGFRFHPADEELVLYYLKRKICDRRLKCPVIGDVDVHKYSQLRFYENLLPTFFLLSMSYKNATKKDHTIFQNSKAISSKGNITSFRLITNHLFHEIYIKIHVLYKAFRKSGPGLKNGDQYGAPFREEGRITLNCLLMLPWNSESITLACPYAKPSLPRRVAFGARGNISSCRTRVSAFVQLVVRILI
ncbi:unnamed protein product [Musa textilis]